MIQQRREDRRLVHHAVLQLRERLAAEAHHGRLHAPAEGGRRIAAEIIVVELVDRLDEQVKFDFESPARGGFRGLYLGIHTRTSDSSFSTSRGFAM